MRQIDFLGDIAEANADTAACAMSLPENLLQ